MLLSLASTLGRYTGIVAAEIVWVFETGGKGSIIYYAVKGSIPKVSKIAQKTCEIATQHAIDSNNPAKVTENLFNCLEFLD